MPEDHQKYLKWNGEWFIEWAEKIGAHNIINVKSILTSLKVEQQSYKSCIGLLKLADKYSVTRLANVWKKALSYTPLSRYKNVKNILATSQNKLNEHDTINNIQISYKF